jgi:putative endonuclease
MSTINPKAILSGLAYRLAKHSPFFNRLTETPRARVGRWGEKIALRAIRQAGLIPLKTNWRARRGEVDIIAFDRRTLVIVEVKTRHASLKKHYTALQAVHAHKRKMLAKTGLAFARNNGPLLRRYAIHYRRLDAIEVYYRRTRLGFLKPTEVLWHRAISSDATRHT